MAAPSPRIQRFGSAANLNLDLHCLVLDGVYQRGTDSAPVLVAVPPRQPRRRTAWAAALVLN